MEASEQKRFGFKRTRKEVLQLRKIEKQHKWDIALDRCDISRLRNEFEELRRASFRAPRQNERKRLIERMIHDIEKRKTCADNEDKRREPLVSAATEKSSGLPCGDSDDTLLPSCIDISLPVAFAAKPDHFVPRTVRISCCISDSIDERRKRAKVEEETLLSIDTVGNALDDFFDSL
ncbi:hypothetical protein ERJ75_000457700 [Trypanosoma vivax]|uniref:Uncharacterized protein n=1 Tax=Trypanosoma vivax (strain Y486) TaxID=1055687 RepID=G0U506_TRYVY|nr:hypothetical protein ERJ75_000457700 [Trypanosoma vivax]CCC50952.1 conserved hypothetical protein [Trypanosoma vivax Y486]